MTFFYFLVLAVLAGFIAWRFLKEGKNKQLKDEYIKNLDASGFCIAKQIILMDFLPKRYQKNIDHVAGSQMGLWVDYSAEKLAVRSSFKETSPSIYSFDELQEFELSKGDTFVYVKVVLGGGKKGVNTVTIPLFKQESKLRGEAGGINIKVYQPCLECANAITGELGNIKRMAQ